MEGDNGGETVFEVLMLIWILFTDYFVAHIVVA